MSQLPKANQSSLPKLDNSAPPDFDVDALLQKGGEILRREISNLLMESSNKKLAPASARDLVAYVKLLHELKLEKQQALAEMSDEELAAMATKS